MKKNLYAVKDIKVMAYSPPFIKETDIEAQRFFYELSQDVKTNINKYPSDFELYKIGTCDDSTGELESDLVFLNSSYSVAETVDPS